MSLIVLYGNLSKNEELEDVIPRGHPEIDVYHTDLGHVFLSLLVPWNYLLLLFIVEEVTWKTYKKFY